MITLHKHIPMKTYLIFFIALVIGMPIMAQTDTATETDADSKIEGVTVFLQGAQLMRTSEILLRKGRNIVHFRGLAKNIDPKSIQVKAPSEVLINSVTVETNYLNLNENKPRVKGLTDSLKIIAELEEIELARKVNLKQEKTMLLANQSLSSKEQGLDVTELQRAVDMFRRRLFDLSDRIHKVDLKLRAFKLQRRKIKAQLKELNYIRNQPSNDIAIALNTYSTRKVPIELSYLVQDAGWVPQYNLRAKNSSSPIQMEYKGDVYQQTGVNWEAVTLTLSTGNPNLGGEKPNLQPWKLYVQAPPPPPTKYKKKISSRSMASPAPKMEEVEEEYDEMSMDDADGEYEGFSEDEPLDFGNATTSLADYTTVQEGATTAEFNISIRQDVPTGNKPQQVTVQNSELASTYRHFATPKMDKDGFLVSEVTGWEDLNLLPGNIQIFFEGTFVAESYIDPAYTKDTLRFSLGRDKRVVIEREQLKDFKEKRIFGSQVERTFAYVIRVRNTKSEAVTIRLEDQIPVSQDKSIEVKTEEISGATLNEENGFLRWDLNIPPSETKEVRLIFTVKHPKNMIVPGL